MNGSEKAIDGLVFVMLVLILVTLYTGVSQV